MSTLGTEPAVHAPPPSRPRSHHLGGPSTRTAAVNMRPSRVFSRTPSGGGAGGQAVPGHDCRSLCEETAQQRRGRSCSPVPSPGELTPPGGLAVLPGSLCANPGAHTRFCSRKRSPPRKVLHSPFSLRHLVGEQFSRTCWALGRGRQERAPAACFRARGPPPFLPPTLQSVFGRLPTAGLVSSCSLLSRAVPLLRLDPRDNYPPGLGSAPAPGPWRVSSLRSGQRRGAGAGLRRAAPPRARFGVSRMRRDQAALASGWSPRSSEAFRPLSP